MKKGFAFSLCVALCLLAIQLPGAHGQNPDAGPPQFLTRPILLHVAEQGLDHGHFVLGNDAATPAPLAPNLGAANYLATSFLAPSLTMGTDRDVSDGSDSYEGETTAAGTGILVGGSNHIYPGNCNTNAATGTFGDCAVKA